MKTSVYDKLSTFFFLCILALAGFLIYGSATGQFETHPSWVYSIDSDGNNTMVSASENELFFWKGRKYTHRSVGHTDAIKTLVFSRDRKYIASGSIDKTIKIWTVNNRKVVFKPCFINFCLVLK